MSAEDPPTWFVSMLGMKSDPKRQVGVESNSPAVCPVGSCAHPECVTPRRKDVEGGENAAMRNRAIAHPNDMLSTH